MLYGFISLSMLTMFAYKRGIFVRAKCESAESEVTRRREKEELLPWAAALLPYAAECVSWELSLSGCVPSPPCIYCNLFFISNTMTLSCGCRQFAEPRKILCQCAYPSLSKYQNTTGRKSPTIGIRAHGLKGYLIFCSKMKVVKIMFWPYYCVDEEETKPLVKTTSKSDVGHGHTRPHAPTKWRPKRADAPHACHASSSPGWTDPTRIPVDSTHLADPDKDDVSMM